MADVNINGLGGPLASPAADDLIPVWDTSAGQTLKIRRDVFVGATITGGGTIALGGNTFTVSGGSPTITGSGTLAFAGAHTLTSLITGVLPTRLQRATATLAPSAYLELVPTCSAYSSQTFMLLIFAWDSPNNNPFDQSFYIASGTNGVFTCFKVGGGTTVTAAINAGKIRITNTHGSTTAIVWADLVETN